MAYAAGEDLVGFLSAESYLLLDDTELPRLLERASELVDDALRTAVYDLAADGLSPAPGLTAEALRKATCAQVEFWLAGSEDDDVLGPLQGVSLGGLQEQYGAGENRSAPMYLAPRAARLLRACPGIRW